MRITPLTTLCCLWLAELARSSPTVRVDARGDLHEEVSNDDSLIWSGPVKGIGRRAPRSRGAYDDSFASRLSEEQRETARAKAESEGEISISACKFDADKWRGIR